jgi:cation transport regulator ChaC
MMDMNEKLDQDSQTEISEEPLRIASRRRNIEWTVNHWKMIDFSKEEGWQLAIDIFEDRIRGRFLDMVKLIQGEPYAGFSVMALDCLLIETLQQFREGVRETPARQSGEYFRRFLTETEFSEYFDGKKADLFYDFIRCGILHMAEIKGTSRILTRKGVPVVKINGPEICPDGLVLNRRRFHAILEYVFQSYVKDLRKNNPPNQELRDRFKSKMDQICKVTPIPYRVGILGYGSLISNPGFEIASHIVAQLPVQTTFPVEYARSSGSRSGAPTLVPASEDIGRPVKGVMFMLDEGIYEQAAKNILYRRELNCVGERRIVYQEKAQKAKKDGLLIKRNTRLTDVPALFAFLPPNIPEVLDPHKTVSEKARVLAELADESLTVQTFCCKRDGIQYLMDNLANQVDTPLSRPYEAAILAMADNAPDLAEARLRLARRKGIIP